MARPIGFVHYDCGHSTPISGAGATVARVCQSCASGVAPVQPRRLSLATILGHKHPSPYCDCDMCQSRIP